MRAAAKKEPRAQAAPRVVYTQAPVLLAVVLGREDGGFRVRLGRTERVLACDPSVDPCLLDEAAASGARVVIDSSGEPVIVGVLSTARAVAIGRDGAVDARVRRFAVTVEEEAVVRSRAAFIQVKAAEVELYGNRVVTRARELAQVLARMIKLN